MAEQLLQTYKKKIEDRPRWYNEERPHGASGM